MSVEETRIDDCDEDEKEWDRIDMIPNISVKFIEREKRRRKGSVEKESSSNLAYNEESELIRRDRCKEDDLFSIPGGEWTLLTL